MAVAIGAVSDPKGKAPEVRDVGQLVVDDRPNQRVNEIDRVAGGQDLRVAARQVAHYVETIPRLYRFVELVGVSDLVQARLGTISRAWRIICKSIASISLLQPRVAAWGWIIGTG